MGLFASLFSVARLSSEANPKDAPPLALEPYVTVECQSDHPHRLTQAGLLCVMRYTYTSPANGKLKVRYKGDFGCWPMSQVAEAEQVMVKLRRTKGLILVRLQKRML